MKQKQRKNNCNLLQVTKSKQTKGEQMKLDTQTKIEKQNSTGSMWRKYIDDGLIGKTIFYSYDTVVGYAIGHHEIDDKWGVPPVRVVNNKIMGKEKGVEVTKYGFVFVLPIYSHTTSKHQTQYRNEFNISKDECFEYDAFIKRAERDGVDVIGGWNN